MRRRTFILGGIAAAGGVAGRSVLGQVADDRIVVGTVARAGATDRLAVKLRDGQTIELTLGPATRLERGPQGRVPTMSAYATGDEVLAISRGSDGALVELKTLYHGLEGTVQGDPTNGRVRTSAGAFRTDRLARDLVEGGQLRDGVYFTAEVWRDGASGDLIAALVDASA